MEANFKRKRNDNTGARKRRTTKTTRVRAAVKEPVARVISGPRMSDSLKLNYANLPKTASFKVKGQYQTYMDSSYSRFFIWANSIDQPVQYYNLGVYVDGSFDPLGYDRMKALYTRYVVHGCKVEFTFYNVTPYSTEAASATTPKSPLLVKIQTVNSQDTVIDPTDASYQFAAQPNCITIPVQSTAQGTARPVKVTRYLTGKQIGGQYWDEADLDWNGLFNDTKPTKYYGMYFYGTSFAHAYLSGVQKIAFNVKYTMYGSAFGSVPLDDV